MSDNKGSALLLVVIIMSIIFMMSSIVFGYSLRTYRLNQDLNDLKKADILTDASLNETVVQVINRLENEDDIDAYTVTNSSPFTSDSNYSYESLVQEEGRFNPSEYIVTGNVKTMSILREIEVVEEDPDAEPDPDPDVDPEPEEEPEPVVTTIAVEVKGFYKEAEVTKRVIITITTTITETDVERDVKIYNCR